MHYQQMLYGSNPYGNNGMSHMSNNVGNENWSGPRSIVTGNGGRSLNGGRPGRGGCIGCGNSPGIVQDFSGMV